MSRQLGTSGEFAAAYVVAQEVAHHVQNERGILDQANRMLAQVDQTESNTASIRIELQADCYSGTWARNDQARFGLLEQGDIGEAMNAAKQIGDDTLQRNSGRPPPCRIRSPTAHLHSGKGGSRPGLKPETCGAVTPLAPTIFGIKSRVPLNFNALRISARNLEDQPLRAK